MKPKPPKFWMVPLCCYAVALLVYFGACGADLLLDKTLRGEGLLQTQKLDFEHFYAEGMILKEGPYGVDLISTDSDSKLIYSPGEPFYVTRFTFEAETTNRPGGEIMLYYTTRPGEDFSAQKRLSARQDEGGGWYFDLGGRSVTALRFDPDTTGGVLWRNWKITLNEEIPPAAYFLPAARSVFLLVFLPVFASAVMVEGWGIHRDFVLRRKALDKPKK